MAVEGCGGPDALFTTNDPANLAVQRILQRGLDQWLAVFRAVDHMEEEIRVRSRHDGDPPVAPSGLSCLGEF